MGPGKEYKVIKQDKIGLGSLPLLSIPKMALWSDWYWIIDYAAPAESLFDLRKILIYTVLKDQLFLQHPDINVVKKQELFESC